MGKPKRTGTIKPSRRKDPPRTPQAETRDEARKPSRRKTATRAPKTPRREVAGPRRSPPAGTGKAKPRAARAPLVFGLDPRPPGDSPPAGIPTARPTSRKAPIVLRDRPSGRLDPRLNAILSLNRELTKDLIELEGQLLSTLESRIKSGRRRTYYSPPLHGLDFRNPSKPTADVLIKFRTEPASVQIPGLQLRASGKRIATARIPLSLLSQLENHPAVEFVELSRPAHPMLDQSAHMVGADLLWGRPSAIRGSGVVIGIVDAGFDFHHVDFRDPNTGQTRIQSLWDQAATTGGVTPPEYGYGREYSRLQINADLNPGPAYSVVPHRAGPNAHGTHVTGIAAGNGKGDARYCGIAPDADLILVNTAPSNELAFGSLDRIVEAIQYVFARAGQAPCVVNISLGDNLGPHDGTSLVEQKIDELLVGTSDRAIVVAAGNANVDHKHFVGSFAPGSLTRLGMIVPAGTMIPEAIEIWYPAEARLTLKIGLPDQTIAGPYLGDGSVLLDELGDVSIRVTPIIGDGRNGANVIEVVLYPASNGAIPDGHWDLFLEETSGADWAVPQLEMHAWVDRNTGISWTKPADREFTLTTPATCQEAVTVGSHTKPAPMEVYETSSCGPTRDGRPKPDIIAPGVGITAARSGATAADPSLYTSMSGTSMAAAHVSGAIALLFEELGPGLTMGVIKQTLKNKADSSGPPAADPMAYGWGRLQIS